ncbi:MAG: pyridoxamine 5'-phosphate oxidase [Legionellales bacterium]|nr:pyridoxamine 5'-phosphate oxidase [Legionellales bacterium]
MNCQQMRRDYSDSRLLLGEMPSDPIVLFIQWYQEAVLVGNNEPNAMVLSTIDESDMPDSRVVLLKEIDDVGFVFFTNYESAKAHQIKHNPHVALNFYWQESVHQVRIRGQAHPISSARSAAYFATRSRESQCAVYASKQSMSLSERELDQRMQEVKEHFGNDSISCPPFWGGYCVEPMTMEFFHGRQARLHDRIRYRRTEQGAWLIERLAP